jgi:hypothetical protein
MKECYYSDYAPQELPWQSLPPDGDNGKIKQRCHSTAGHENDETDFHAPVDCAVCLNLSLAQCFSKPGKVSKSVKLSVSQSGWQYSQ